MKASASSYRFARCAAIVPQLRSAAVPTLFTRKKHDRSYIDDKATHPKIELDSSTINLLDDMSLGIGSSHRSSRRKRPLIYEDENAAKDALDRSRAGQEVDGEIGDDLLLDHLMSESEEMEALDEVARFAGDDLFASFKGDSGELDSSISREGRLSPAASFGSKRIGMVVLPEELTSAVQKRVDESDNRKLLRQAYLSKMSTKKSPLSAPAPRSSSKRAHLSSSLQEHNASPGSSSHTTRRSEAVTPLTALLSAIVDLPAEYAAVRNVLRELKGRLDEGEWRLLCGEVQDLNESSSSAGEPGSGRWAIVDGGVGAGLWAVQDAMNLLQSSGTARDRKIPTTSHLGLDVIHGSRHILELATSLAEDVKLEGDVQFARLYRPTAKPSVILAPFYLSKLPNQPARRRKLQELWDTGAETLILIDEGSAEGFRIIADARQYLLDLGRQTPVAAEGLSREEIDRMLLREKRRAKKARQKARAFEGVGGVLEMVDGQEVLRIGDQLYYPETIDGAEPSLTTAEGEKIEDIEDMEDEPPVPRPVTSDRFIGSHVIAPCPHDGVCPLLATRDSCHFSQRLQTPRFARKTKHKKDGESDSNYSYVIIRRGNRPEARTQGSGLFGAVAREEQERNAQKEESMQQGMIVPIKGAQDGSYEVMRYIPSKVSSKSSEPLDEAEQETLEQDMRKEAYRWPRLVYPPLKRSGHVVMDTCHPSGSIVRLTIPKSQSKQAYYDARKANWGDLFPHAPKTKETVRERGIKRLNKFEQPEPVEEIDDDELVDILVSEDWPVAKLVDVAESEGKDPQTKLDDDVIVRTFG